MVETLQAWWTARIARQKEIDASIAAKAAGLPFLVLGDSVATKPVQAAVSTMHLAKGLEFSVVAVLACDDEIVPLQERIESVGDDADLQEVYDTERHLLYVACTRACDHLLISAVKLASEFLEDFEPSGSPTLIRSSSKEVIPRETPAFEMDSMPPDGLLLLC